MQRGRRLSVLAAVVAALAMPAPAWAYLDPGSSSMILQVLLGGVAGIVVLARIYWRRLLVLLRLRSPETEKQLEGESPPPPRQ